ncbi:hypothetical protein BHE74_00033861 [Ensete ventricosum]|nr:hypothetical protein BHE74_00033861 [Ensete ventricosum]
MARGRPAGEGDDGTQTRTTLGILSSFFFSSSSSSSLFLPQSIADNRFLPKLTADGRNRLPTTEIDRCDRFWWYRPIAGDPRTDNLTDRYIPPGTSGTDQYGKPWLLLIIRD